MINLGFGFRVGGTWKKNEYAPLVDLESLPALDFSIFPQNYLYKPMMGEMYRTISLDLTRGCPYSCSYCCDYSLTEKFRTIGRWFRQKSLRKIDAELCYYVERYAPQFIYMMSESFLAGSLERVKGFFDAYKPFSIPFWFNTRSEDITEKKIQLAKEVGCHRVSIGIESGNEIYRKNMMHRNVSNKRIIEAGSVLRDYGVSFSVNIIIGSPDETREMIFDSIELARAVRADAVSTHIFNPFHGTEFRNICVEKGYIESSAIADDFFQGYILKGGVLSAEEVAGLFRTIPLYVKFPKSEYALIKRAEKFDEKGNQLFEQFKKEFYQLSGW